MLYAYAIVLALLAQQGVPMQPAQETPAVAYDEGPLAANLVGMREIRYYFPDPAAGRGVEPSLAMQVRLQGERLKELARVGNLIFTELVDDTGQSLISADTYTDEMKTATRRNQFGADRIKQQGIALTAQVKPGARTATKLEKVRGTVKLVFAKDVEQVTIDNPLQYVGKTIESPRLSQLGIEIRVLTIDQFEQQLPADRCVLLQVAKGEDNLQSASFVDGWMKPVQARETSAPNRAGEPCIIYYMDASALTDELQLVLEVHPNVETVDFVYEATDLPLP